MIFPKDQSVPEIKNRKPGFTSSKLPVYILYIFNWIPYKSDTSKCSYIQALIILIIHVTGVLTFFSFIYGVLSTIGQNAPIILKYIFITLHLYYQVNTFLFMYNSWIRKKTTLILELLDQNSLPYLWPAKHKIYLFLMMLFIGGNFGSLFIFIFYVQDYKIKKVIFSFLGDNKDIIGYLHQIYFLYTGIFCCILPVFISYICTCLNIMIDNLKTTLKVMENTVEISTEDFQAFLKNLDQMIDMVSMIDECFSINIGWLLTLLINNIITFLHTEILFGDCKVFIGGTFRILSDVIAAFILLISTATVYSKVTVLYQI